ncbi:MAG TPA: NADH-quinone oxidoreductase subunit NuoH [Gemmataceae bacterium]|nr:NADH-quinone oxidoreductase subunit NuoH [Gemmataceae bacterium]
MTEFLSSRLGLGVAELIVALIAAVILITFMLLSAIYFVWLERKVSARIQDRLGPTRVGGKFGWLQTLADGLKLLVKEDIIPDNADHVLFRLGPYIALAGSFLAFVALPFGNGVVAQNMNIAVFYMLAVMSSEVFGVILGGYGSGSKWALFGGMREAAQVVSYEVPRAISVLVPVIVAGTMNLNTIGVQQAGPFWKWYVFHDPFTFGAFWTFFTCGTASCKRAPFDLAEAESELVAGFHTEYSGFRWLIFFMAEYGSMFAISGIAVILFLGGWHLGFLPWDLSDKLPVLGNIINVAVFIIKGWLLVFVMMWVRWTLPRLRIDQVMTTCLRYLVPISCVLLVGVSIWQLLTWEFPLVNYCNYLIAALCLVFVIWTILKLMAVSAMTPTQLMPGAWPSGLSEKGTGPLDSFQRTRT